MSGVTWELLDRFLSRECTAEERQQVQQWIEEAPSRAASVALLAVALAPAPAGLKTGAWAWLRRQLVTGGSFSLERRSRGLALAQVAVVGFVIAGLGFATWWWSIRGFTGQQLQPPQRVITTPSGQRASFQLPDGSRVILGVASTLRHPAGFGPGVREVELEGAAYFEVAHDESRLFLVRAGGLVAEDLGTEFMVRAYPEDRSARVVVRSGSVSLRPATTSPSAESQVLLAGQLGWLAANGRAVVEQADTSAYFAWTQGWLVFDAVPLLDALPQLSRWYDLDFRVTDSTLGRVPLTATLRNQPTDEVLQLLAASLGMRHVRRGRVVTFHSANRAR